MKVDELLVATAAKAAATSDPSAIIEAAFGKLTRQQRDDLAREWFAECVHSVIRANTRAAERRAQRPSPVTRKPAGWYSAESQYKHGSTDQRYGGVIYGCACDECSTHRSIVEDHQTKLHAAMTSIMNDYKDQLRVEWTAELLASTFGIGDGTLVTWGEATVEQHRDRIEMFKANAIANIEGAARHEAALDTLATTGAPCLNAAVLAQAA